MVDLDDVCKGAGKSGASTREIGIDAPAVHCQPANPAAAAQGLPPNAEYALAATPADTPPEFAQDMAPVGTAHADGQGLPGGGKAVATGSPQPVVQSDDAQEVMPPADDPSTTMDNLIHKCPCQIMFNTWLNMSSA